MKPIKFNDLTWPGWLRSELDAAYERVMSSGCYIGGYEVEAFEKEWAEYCEVDYCVACGNGFDALQLVLRAMYIGQGDSIIVPEWTAVPTWAAVESVFAIPVINSTSMNTICIGVYLYGIPFNRMSTTIIDAAQAHGIKQQGDIMTWSFYPTKNLGCYGDGGAITTTGNIMSKVLRKLRRYGRPGAINSCLDPLQAAFLRVKLPYLDGWNEIRRQHAARYLDGLKDVPGIALPEVPDWCEPVWHQFVIQAPRRDELMDYLSDKDIETMIHYPVPPHRALGYDYDLPEADRLAREVLSLPVAPHLTDGEIDAVIEAVKEWAG